MFQPRSNNFIYLILVILTVAVFWQLPSFDFINFDDSLYVTENPHIQAGLSIKNIIWSFKTTYATNWHPLTWLSHMLDCQLFGLNPGMHHFSSLLLHILNTLLLFTVFNKMTGKQLQSAVLAILFAIHPLHVESVAWISERKDVLSTLFWLLTMYAYTGYVEFPKIGRYLAVLLFYIMGLMAKQMLVTLPFVLLLMDLWPLNRSRFYPADGKNNQSSPHKSISWLIFEKIPLFVISFLFSIICIFAQNKAVQSIDSVPLLLRLSNVFISYSQYLSKTIWPSHLAVFYPYPASYPIWQVAGSVLLFAFLSIILICKARKYPYMIVGWLWFIGTLVPVIGLMQVGKQAMADRYTYVPLIGLFIIVAWGAPDLFLKKYHFKKKLFGGFSCILLSALMICAFMQVNHWQNSIALFNHAIKVTDNNWLAYNNLAGALNKQGNYKKALVYSYKTIEIKPNHLKAHINIGVASSNLGKIKEAIKHYLIALQINPQNYKIHNNIGVLFAKNGDLKEAADHFIQAVHLNPDYAEAYGNLGIAKTKQGNLEEAIKQLQKALDLKPDYTKARIHLENALNDYKK